MMYPFMTRNDGTEIVHSEMKPDGRVKVYFETPDAQLGFRHATCWLPEYRWEDIRGYTAGDIAGFQDIVESTAHLILEFAQEGGFQNASDLQNGSIHGCPEHVSQGERYEAAGRHRAGSEL